MYVLNSNFSHLVHPTSMGGREINDLLAMHVKTLTSGTTHWILYHQGFQNQEPLTCCSYHVGLFLKVSRWLYCYNYIY